MPARLVYINNRTSETITLSTNGPYYLVSAGNMGTAPVETQTQRAPYQDGAAYIDSRLEPRTIAINVFIKATSEADLVDKRRKLVRVFNPKDGEGTLKWQGAIERNIKAVPNPGVEFPGGESIGPNWQRCTVYLLAAKPLFYDPEINKPIMAAFLGGLSFPFSFPMSFSTAGSKLEMKNMGDVAAPVEIDFYGPALNPIVRNETTGKHIKVIKEILDGEVLKIRTAQGEKSVVIVKGDGSEENAMHYLDDTSEFWHLEPGANTVSYEEESGSQDAEVYVRWYDYYIGI